VSFMRIDSRSRGGALMRLTIDVVSLREQKTPHFCGVIWWARQDSNL
jgi:hypothetical protein